MLLARPLVFASPGGSARFVQDLAPQRRHEKLHHFLVGLGQPAGFGRRCSVAGLVLDVFHQADQHLGRAKIGTRQFVDHLRHDRLALGDLAAPPVDRHDHRLVQRIGQQRRPPELPDYPFLKRVCSGGRPGPICSRSRCPP